MIVYIYILTNEINNKQYVGVSKNPKIRLKKHYKANSIIGMALRKYGSQVDFSIVAQVDGYKAAFELEKFYIKDLNTIAPNGYNLTVGGEGHNSPHSEETKTKISNANKGKKRTKETRAKIGAFHIGKHHSKETKEKMSASHKGKKHTEESKAKMRKPKSKK